MTFARASALLAAILASQTAPVFACVPLAYEEAARFTARAAADQMVADAASIEIMRVTARTTINHDPAFREVYLDGPYQFRLETVELLKGAARGTLSVYGFDRDTRLLHWPEYRFPRPAPLWWTGADGYALLRDTVLLNPDDATSSPCESTLMFAVGEEYLVFRDRLGELLFPAYRSIARASPAQRPVIELLHGDSDPWLSEVRGSLARQ